MKSFLGTACKSMIVLSLGLTACGRDKGDSEASTTQNFADESVDPNGAFTAIAEDQFSGQQFIQTGATEADAIKNALELCNARTSPSGNGGLCTLKGRVIRNGMGTRIGGEPAESWACLIQENTTISGGVDRSWIGVGPTPQAARAAAEAKCEQKAGIQCQVRSCFNADTDKYQI